MQLESATRKKAKIKMAIQGASGSGKTMSALLIAYGLCNYWSKIAVIDSENYSASLYAHLGNYSVLNIGAPFTPEKYIEAIRVCEKAGIEVIIVDSISHEWDGLGGILDINGNMPGNSFTNWSKITPRHNAFVQTILQSPAHIIGTIRSKQEYILSERNGKQIPEKVGLKGITRSGMDYEFTLVFDLDMRHKALASKDRTSLFMDKPHFEINSSIGEQIAAWCQQGIAESTEEMLMRKIKTCTTYEELKQLYHQHPDQQTSLTQHFSQRKRELAIPITQHPFTPNLSHHGNGTTT